MTFVTIGKGGPDLVCCQISSFPPWLPEDSDLLLAEVAASGKETIEDVNFKLIFEEHFQEKCIDWQYLQKWFEKYLTYNRLGCLSETKSWILELAGIFWLWYGSNKRSRLSEHFDIAPTSMSPSVYGAQVIPNDQK